jgi:ABC-type glycerol-3-phosphate transport system substrate-binding protein
MACALLLSAVACNKTSNEANNTPKETKAAEETKEPAKTAEVKEPKKVETFSVLMFTEWYKKGWEFVEKAIDENAETLGFRLEIEKISGGAQGSQLMKTRFASQEYPDFFELQSAYDVEMNLGGRQQIQEIVANGQRTLTKHYCHLNFILMMIKL